MFTLLLFVASLGIVLGLNLRAQVEKTWSGNVGTWLNGYREFPADRLSVSRGWPLRYLDHSQFVQYGTGDALIEAGWPRTDGSVPRISHFGRLVVNVAVGLAVMCGLTYATARLGRFFTRRREITTGTGHMPSTAINA
jgi:hypothetical protein